MIIGKLTSKKVKHLPTGEWLANLKDIPYKDEGYSLTELAEFIGITKVSVIRVFKGLIEPDRRKVGKTYASYYSAEELRSLGRDYASGKVYKIEAEEEA